MGNCSGINASVHTKPSVVKVGDICKGIQYPVKPWKLVTLLSNKTQPSLFDYDDSEVSKCKTQIERSGKYVTTNKGLQVFSADSTTLEGLKDPTIELAVDLKLTDETLEVKAATEGKELWRVLRSTPLNKCNKSSLHENDVIKLGNFHCFVKKIQMTDGCSTGKSSMASSHEDVLYRYEVEDEIEPVREISQNIKSCTSNEPHFIQMKYKPSIQTATLDEKQKGICRICLSEDSTPTDPLISPCKCSGSMKWIHLECLRKWLSNKIEIVEDEVIKIYAWKEIACELCKSNLKTDLVSEDSQVQLLDLKQFKSSFISFVSLDPDEQQKYYLFILNLDKQSEINIGRFTECDLRINEISVSRYHSKIYKKAGKVFIEDLQSKFGTLIKVPEQGLLIDRHLKGSVALQSGRSFFQVSNL